MLTLTSSKAAKAASKSNTRTKAKAVTVEEVTKSQLWTEKYRPQSVADLPVHHSKVGIARSSPTIRESEPTFILSGSCFQRLAREGSGDPRVLL